MKDVLDPEHDVWLKDAIKIVSQHFDERGAEVNENIQSKNSTGQKDVDLLVIHNISLPPAIVESDFDNCFVEDFFTGQLDCSVHSYFEQIEGLRVSSHLYIKRDGTVIQFVPLNKRAWHAGLSEFQGRTKCNDFSIGIEMQGTDEMDYTNKQYEALVLVTKQIQDLYPLINKEHIVGHEHISPGRKTDPGQSFDWTRYKNAL